MIIKDKEDNILALFIYGEDISKGKNFITENESQFQLASFLLNKDEVIERHFHPNQDRNIKNTSEVLVLLDGSIEVTIYDGNLELVTTQIINSGDTVALISGGHGLKLLKESKFIEVKQGPYDEKTDKVRF